MESARHGKDGWQLIDYSWNPNTGDGRFEYERIIETDDDESKIETEVVYRHQDSWLTK